MTDYAAATRTSSLGRPSVALPLDRGLETVIRQALADARDAGRDSWGQIDEAVRTISWVRPDMTVSEAMVAVVNVQQS